MPKFLRTLLLARQHAAFPVRLNQRRIYILPTRSGLVFGFFLLAMLVAAVNYTNNLAFLLTFLLAGIAIISSIHAYANLAGLILEHGRLSPAFCGEEAQLQLFFRAAGRERRALQVKIGKAGADLSLTTAEGRAVDLLVPVTRRGLLPLGQVTISTRFPLGLFRAWSLLILPVTGLVYPRLVPAKASNWAMAQGDGDGGDGGAAPGMEFGGVRPYQPGDGLSRVSWKASARGLGLFVKEYGSVLVQTLYFEWNEVHASGYEDRISRLAGLVHAAEQMGVLYGLSLPGQTISPGSGAAHAHRCLEALALMPEAE
ncbi:MAG: DUF58 domain-containing protein [Desulfovibrionales bacterium]|nr:DUF58 domain-containing protein [Desulfovibrionales bacterium]